MKVIGQKTNVKSDPTVKRVICKGCNVILIPGASSTVRVKSACSAYINLVRAPSHKVTVISRFNIP
ncbi:hypothetical protein M405DRAFT_814782, partial [Rhizopogon salebrosus TDB-379]